MYAVLTLTGLGLALVLCQSFAQRITRPILALEDSATSLASGNLTVPDVPVESGDEIGTMTNAFNQMKQQLHRLLGQMSATSERLSAASQELAAIAQQSANASLDVAETVEDVATGMDLQLKDIDWVKQNVDAVFIDIDNMSKLAEVASAEVDSDAVDKMGEIVETISAISDQTNLLAQNVVNLVEAMDSIDTVSRKTSENTQIISAATEEQSASNEEIAAASQSLAKLASDMQDAVHKFKL
jgi:methyl-accepting chemotaxis protein